MTAAEWKKCCGNPYLITLTDEERRYLALSPLSPKWETITCHSNTNLRFTV